MATKWTIQKSPGFYVSGDPFQKQSFGSKHVISGCIVFELIPTSGSVPKFGVLRSFPISGNKISIKKIKTNVQGIYLINTSDGLVSFNGPSIPIPGSLRPFYIGVGDRDLTGTTTDLDTLAKSNPLIRMSKETPFGDAVLDMDVSMNLSQQNMFFTVAMGIDFLMMTDSTAFGNSLLHMLGLTGSFLGVEVICDIFIPLVIE
jgi:hypothetical protein